MVQSFVLYPGMTFKAYMDNVRAKTGKTEEGFWKLAIKKHFVKQGKIVAKHRRAFGMAKVRNWTEYQESI